MDLVEYSAERMASPKSKTFLDLLQRRFEVVHRNVRYQRGAKVKNSFPISGIESTYDISQ